MIDSLLPAWAVGLHWAEWSAVVTALVYVGLAARSSAWCWPFGFVSAVLWAWTTYALYGLVSDALLQVFYAVMAVVGWWQWQHGRTTASGRTAQLPITTLPLRAHLLWSGLAAALALVLGFGFSYLATAVATYPDAFTTTFSVLATFLLIRRKLENWLYWVVVDLAYGWLYFSRGAVLFGLLMVVYVGMAVYGYVTWRRGYKGRDPRIA